MTGERPAASGQGAVAGYWPLAAGRSPLALLLLYAALVVPALFTRDLWDPDEPRFAQIGREMLRTGDWVLPRMNGEPLALLPPLHDWVSAAFGALAGDVTPAASRAGAALGGLLAVAAVFWLARRWWGNSAASWSAVVLMSSARFWLEASYAQVDMLLTGLLAAAFVSFRVAWEEEDRGLRWFLAGCVFCGLGTLTKGPLALVAPGLVFLALAAVERRRGFLRVSWLAAGLVLYLTIVTPWYVLACRRGGDAFARELLLTHNFGMFFETWSHKQPPWYYLMNLPWMLAPWIVFLPAAAMASRDALRPSAATLTRAFFRPETRDPEADRHRFLWAWFLVLFAFFSVSQAKQTKYLLPAFPAAAMILGRWMAAEGKRPRAALGLLAAVGAVAFAAAAVAWVLRGGWPVKEEIQYQGAMLALPGLLVATGLAAWAAAPWVASRPRAFSVVASGTAWAFLMAAVVAFPRVDQLKSARPLCDRTRSRISPGEEVGIYGIQERKIGAFRYYLDHSLATFEDRSEHPDSAALAAWWLRPGPRWLLVDTADPLPPEVRSSSRVVDHQDIGHREIEVLQKP